MKKKKIMVIYGTRPEAIKMAPVINRFKKEKNINVSVCVTAQHREMLDQINSWFNIDADYDLNLMKDNQFISEITADALREIENILSIEKPDIILVEGDTTTAFVGALAAFYQKIPIGYLESGLRTWNKYSPYPEEINRVLISHLADLHFAPTQMSKRNLEMENIKSKNIFVTGNTVIDALFNTIERFDKDYLLGNNKKISLKNKFILVTVHRRENFGEPLKNICLAIKELVQKEKIEAEIIIPVHLNPNVRGIVFALLRNIPNIHLVDPLNYPVFCNLMAKSYLILTDSGGIQEEAPSLGKPVLVLRENTERPEGVNAGTVRIVGRKKENIIKEVKNLIENKKAYIKMSKAKNPYGDGHSSERIIKTILRFLND